MPRGWYIKEAHCLAPGMTCHNYVREQNKSKKRNGKMCILHLANIISIVAFVFVNSYHTFVHDIIQEYCF